MNPVQKTILAFIVINVATIAGIMIWFVYDVTSSIIRWRKIREETSDGNYRCVQCGRQNGNEGVDVISDAERGGKVRAADECSEL